MLLRVQGVAHGIYMYDMLSCDLGHRWVWCYVELSVNLIGTDGN